MLSEKFWKISSALSSDFWLVLPTIGATVASIVMQVWISVVLAALGIVVVAFRTYRFYYRSGYVYGVTGFVVSYRSRGPTELYLLDASQRDLTKLRDGVGAKRVVPTGTSLPRASYSTCYRIGKHDHLTQGAAVVFSLLPLADGVAVLRATRASKLVTRGRPLDRFSYRTLHGGVPLSVTEIL